MPTAKFVTQLVEFKERDCVVWITISFFCRWIKTVCDSRKCFNCHITIHFGTLGYNPEKQSNLLDFIWIERYECEQSEWVGGFRLSWKDIKCLFNGWNMSLMRKATSKRKEKEGKKQFSQFSYSG